ncbi:MAG: ABC-F family ATP-binding cassette domain-containing protein [Oscillospiraceae bacterium]|jgi:ATP-binding cassette subfamily F protein 3|nr:ABC-F family ATP-binding cassette domain-containing protein [Oscillospiraceae bacterium]
MAILTLQNLSMSFETRSLFAGVHLLVEAGDRIALVGANGCGKTTLLRLITGELQADGGAILRGRDTTLSYAAQTDAAQDPSATAYEAMLDVFADLIALEREIEQLNIRLAQSPSDELLHRQAECAERFQSQGGLTFRSRARATLLGLGFAEEDHTRPIGTFSGGQQAKLRLGRLLLSPADLLLLDEPTNHLDLHAVEWLEGFLRDYKGAVIMVSHDRWFLDQAATRTAELHHGKLQVWNGGYSSALRQKQTQTELDRKHYEQQAEEIKRIEGIIEQQKRFGQARNFVTIASKQKQIDRLKADLIPPDGSLRGLRFQFPPVPETGNEVLRVTELSFGYDPKNLLFDGLSALIEKGDRAFLLGENGCGKTTLFQLILHRLRPTRGCVRLGANVRLGYYDQNLADIISAKTVLDDIWDTKRTLTQTQVRSLLGMFLFSGDDVFKTVDCLSGGERARLALLKLILSGANVLLLDEPTNHLDIASREALEEALSQFEGTIFAVSHDRYFINKLATKVYHLRPRELRFCGVRYEDYLAGIQTDQTDTIRKKKEKPPNDYQLRKEKASEYRKKVSAFTHTEAEILQEEASERTLCDQLQNPEVAADYAQILDLTTRLEETRARLAYLYDQWETIHTEIEAYELEQSEL